MAHPLRSDVAAAHTAKLRSLTSDYGSASGPANNITTPQERLKGEGGEHHVGFGADSSNATSKRGDRPARRSAAANPVPTYAKGGKVKHRDSGGDVSPIEEANKDQAEAAPKADGGVIARAKGGRTKHKGSTHVNVIVAPQGGLQGGMPPGPTGPIPPQLAALAGGAKPPMAGPPPAPPMGPPPGGPPGVPPMPMRAKGGIVMGNHPDASQDKALIKETLKQEGLVRKAKGGGVTMHAGAVTGIGRLEKMGKHPPLHKGSMSPKAV